MPDHLIWYGLIQFTGAVLAAMQKCRKVAVENVRPLGCDGAMAGSQDWGVPEVPAGP